MGGAGVGAGGVVEVVRVAVLVVVTGRGKTREQGGESGTRDTAFVGSEIDDTVLDTRVSGDVEVRGIGRVFPHVDDGRASA